MQGKCFDLCGRQVVCAVFEAILCILACSFRHTPIEQIILDERASLLRDLLKLVKVADESYREQLAPRVAEWQALLDQTIEAARAHMNMQQRAGSGQQ